MAIYLNNKVGIKVATYDLSDLVTNVTLNRSFDELEITAFGDSGHRYVKGLEASSVTIDFLNDSATNKTLQTLQSEWGKTTAVVLIQDKDAAVSATNPLYTFNVLINNTTPINGSPADISMQSVTWNVQGATTVATTGSF